MTPLDQIAEAAKAHLWTARRLAMGGPVEGVECRTVALPGVRLVAITSEFRPGIRARLLVCGIERAQFDRLQDVLDVFEDPSQIGPRCRIWSCDRPSRHDGGVCPLHEAGADPDNEARYARGEKGAF